MLAGPRAVGSGLLAALCLLVGFDAAPVRALREGLFDGYQRAMPRVRESAPAIIVEIDERSLDARGQWPWPRTEVAELLRAILAARPAAVGVDLLFVEPDRSGGDAALAQAIQNRNVVLGIAGLESRDRRFPFPPRAAPVRLSRELPLRRYDGHLQSRAEISRAAAGLGLLSTESTRRVPLVARVGPVVVAALSVEMLRVASGASALRIDEALHIGEVKVPIQPDGTFHVHFGPHDPQRFVSADMVMSGRADPQLLRDKLVLVGITGLGLLDFQATPLGERIPGVEVHAQILEQIFDGRMLRRPAAASWMEALLLALVGVALIAIVPRFRPLVWAAFFLAIVVALAALGIFAFRGGLLVDVAAPALGAALVMGIVLAATLAEADRQRRALREAQARVAGELEAARRIQAGLLPDPRRRFAGESRFALEALLEPARTVGGDFYDCFMLDERRVFFVVADVSGKGLPASLFMALSKSLLKSIALRGGEEPARVLERASAEISRDNTESLFVTAFAGVLDAETGRLVYCNAGHEPPLLCRPGAAPQRIVQSGGPPLCVIEGYSYASAELVLPAGASLCVVTDGVTEAMNVKGELYGAQRLAALLAGLPSVTPEAVRDDVRRFAGGALPSDDLTLLCVRFSGR